MRRGSPRKHGRSFGTPTTTNRRSIPAVRSRSPSQSHGCAGSRSIGEGPSGVGWLPASARVQERIYVEAGNLELIQRGVNDAGTPTTQSVYQYPEGRIGIGGTFTLDLDMLPAETTIFLDNSGGKPLVITVFTVPTLTVIRRGHRLRLPIPDGRAHPSTSFVTQSIIERRRLFGIVPAQACPPGVQHLESNYVHLRERTRSRDVKYKLTVVFLLRGPRKDQQLLLCECTLPSCTPSTIICSA